MVEGSLNDLLEEFVYLLHYYTKEPDDGLKITRAEHEAYYWFLS